MAPHTAKRGALRALGLMMTVAATFAMVALPAFATAAHPATETPAADGAVCGALGTGLPADPIGPTCGILNTKCKEYFPASWCDYWI